MEQSDLRRDLTKIVLDKLVLGLVLGMFGLFGSMKLEAYKRDQAALSEAARIRYAAVERVLRSLGTLEAAAIKYQALDRSKPVPSPQQAMVMRIPPPGKRYLFDLDMEKLRERKRLAEELQARSFETNQVILESEVLLGPTLAGAALNVGNVLVKQSTRLINGGTRIDDAASVEVRRLKEKFEPFFPDLPRSR